MPDQVEVANLGKVFGDVLKTLRQDKGLAADREISARDLASRIGCHYRSVYRYEAGETIPGAEYILSFERALDLPAMSVWKSLYERLGLIVPPTAEVRAEVEEIMEEAQRKVDWSKNAIYWELLNRGKEAKSDSFRQAIGVSGSDRLLSHLHAFDEAYPGAGKVAARWIGGALRLGFEKQDDRVLRETFGEHFRPPESLDQEDIYWVGMALLQALGWMAPSRGFKDAPADWSHDTTGEQGNVTS